MSLTVEAGDLRFLSDLETPLELTTPDGRVVFFQPGEEYIVFDYGGVRFKIPSHLAPALEERKELPIHVGPDEPENPFPGMLWFDPGVLL